MASESIAHEAEGLMGYWLRAHSGSRNNCQVNIAFNQTKIENTPYICCYSQYLDFPVIEESLLRNDIYTVVIQ